MPTITDSRLHDALTRHQVYLEGLKLGYTQDFIDRTEKLRQDLRDAFREIEFDDLSFLTRRELELFIRKLLLVQQAHYSVYTKELLDDLREFMDADTEMQAEVLRETQDYDKAALIALAALLTAKKRDRLWVTILNAPVPATGAVPEDMIAYFSAAGGLNIEQAVRKAWANRATVTGTLNSLVGTARLNYRDGVIYRSIPQADGLVATILQHVAGIVQAATARTYFDRYRWLSVLDDRTTQICESRNGNIYVYGKGPLPPAHYRCRSHVEPYDGGDEFVDESFAEWLRRQPKNVQDDIMSGAQPGNKYEQAKPLTLAEFVGKLKLILAG